MQKKNPKNKTLRLSHNYNALLAFISEYIHFKTVQTRMLQLRKSLKCHLPAPENNLN